MLCQMAIVQLNNVIRNVRSIMLRRTMDVPDSELLQLYVQRGDEAAFEGLLRRHGPMVWGVCRRVLSSRHDAEDAFQTTFLVLVRKAATLKSPSGLANWLYGVAYRSALAVRRSAARRRAVEANASPVATTIDPWADLLPLLDRELNQIPDKYREILVLCDLEGRTRKEAARKLGLPEGTAASRLARARTMLARRMARHGPVIGGVSLTLVLAPHAAPAAVPSALTGSTIKAVALIGAGHASASVVSVKVAGFTEAVLKAMMLTRLKMLTVALALAVLAGGTVGLASLFDDPGPAARASADLKTIDGLIRQLASKDFSKRAAASKALADIGEPTLDALRAAARTSVELEVHRRIDRLIHTIEGRWQLHCFKGHTDAIPSLAMARLPDRWLAITAGRSEHTVRLWDIKKRKELHRLDGHTSWVWSVVFSKDGKRALSGGVDGVRLWDVASGKELRHFIGHERQVYRVALAADGRRALSGSQDHTARLWDVDTGKELCCFRNHTDEVSSVALSPDGKWAVSAGLDNIARLWDIATGKELRQFPGIWTSEFSPDGRQLLTTGRDKSVRLWNLATGKELLCLNGHTAEVCCAAFSSDCKRALTGGSDNTVRVWDLHTGKELRCLKGHTDAVSGVAFTPDGTQCLSAAYDHTIRLWQLPK